MKLESEPAQLALLGMAPVVIENAMIAANNAVAEIRRIYRDIEDRDHHPYYGASELTQTRILLKRLARMAERTGHALQQITAGVDEGRNRIAAEREIA